MAFIRVRVRFFHILTAAAALVVAFVDVAVVSLSVVTVPSRSLPPLSSSSMSRASSRRFMMMSSSSSKASPSPSSPSSSSPTSIPSWDDLKSQSETTPVGKALANEVQLRKEGKGSAHVQNTLRTFQSDDKQKEPPSITLYRDHAGWCPYCQKTMLLVEEKEIPIKIGLVPMRSYGDKPREFLQKVPSGLLPAIELNGKVITESQVIMELLDEWHTVQDGYKPMLPDKNDRAKWDTYNSLARLERELFSWWCTLVFRPDGGGGSGGLSFNNPFAKTKTKEMSAAMKGFMDCIGKVDQALLSTKGPWFFDDHDYPTMIDFIYVSHVERMLASTAFWKGLNLRDPKWNLKGLNAWLEAFEKREAYLAFKSDYFTHVMDIPPQYGPGYDGGFESDRQKFSSAITGRDGSWTLPLAFDDPLQPLYKGPPLPLCVLASLDLRPGDDGTYESADPVIMERACRSMAAWKLAGNGSAISKFAARGGPLGSKNPRKSFGGPLADPYAEPDPFVQPHVDAALRVVCSALLEEDGCDGEALQAAVPKEHAAGVKASLAYLRDRVGVPRDLPLAAARYLRAYLNWAITNL